MTDDKTIQIELPYGPPPDETVTEWKYEVSRVQRGRARNGYYMDGNGCWVSTDNASINYVTLVAIPVARKPEKVKVRVLLFRDANGAPFVDLGNSLCYCGGEWRSWGEPELFSIPESDWPEPGGWKWVTVEVDAVAGEDKGEGQCR